MASTISPLLQTIPLRRASFQVRASKSSPAATAIPGRRQLIFSLTAVTAAAAIGERSSRAESIGLFGIRKGLRKVEETAEEIVREGFEAADKGIETAERGIEAAERGIETAEKEIETAVGFDGLAQAGAVAVAEVLGVLVATTVVNGILGPEAQKS
ncbi:hypothetical protein L484_011749 [Morus notabilis]|uniref:Synechocystis YCF37 n=1 Tax=Morus notabilis TaxID=981085 RepID=W9RXB0_9ROSA|nr:uncharacterized protein LOC21394990 [Morus notabilis]EXB96706.1 hypothetical protein L484_011749 [Morus notabilis]